MSLSLRVSKENPTEEKVVFELGNWQSLSSFSTRHSRRNFLRKDGIVILIAVALGSFVELFWPWNGNHPPFGRLRDPLNPELFYKPMNWQHFTMYFFFGIYGCARIIEHGAPFLTGVWIFDFFYHRLFYHSRFLNRLGKMRSRASIEAFGQSKRI